MGWCSGSEREQTTEPSNGMHLRCKRGHREDFHDQDDAAVMPTQASPEDPTRRPSLEEATYPFRHLSALTLIPCSSCSRVPHHHLQPWRTCCSPAPPLDNEQEEREAYSRAAAPLFRRWERPGLGVRLRTLMNPKPRVEGNENHDYPFTNGHQEVLLPPGPSQSPQVIPGSTESYVNHNLHSVWSSHFIFNPSSRWKALKYL